MAAKLARSKPDCAVAFLNVVGARYAGCESTDLTCRELQTTVRYAHLADDPLRDAANQFQVVIGRADSSDSSPTWTSTSRQCGVKR